MTETNISLKTLIEQEINSGDIKLPIIDEVASSLNRILNKENANIKELATLIEKDPSLTAKVLNLANSSVYSGLVKIKNVDQAITRVGLQSMRQFLITAYLKESLPKLSPTFRDMMKIYWRHSLACAICSRKIAENLNLRSIAEDSYFLGLLHDIGIISIFSTLDKIAKDKKRNFELNEGLIREILKTFHSALGAKILHIMNFDPVFSKIVEFHDTPESFPEKDNNLFNILNVSDNLLNKIGISFEVDNTISILGLETTGRLKLDPLFVATLEVDIEDMMVKADEML